MQVETYEVESNPEGGALELTDEAIELIRSLNLEGQQELIATREAGTSEVRTICPYREMTGEERAVYGELLTKQMRVEAYNRGPIPLRVLQVIALAQREQWFQKLVVWCPESASDRDPILVGVRTDPQQSWRTTEFLLARWGEALESLEELKKRARLRWIERQRAHAQEQITKAQAFIANIEAEATRHFNGDRTTGLLAF